MQIFCFVYMARKHTLGVQITQHKMQKICVKMLKENDLCSLIYVALGEVNNYPCISWYAVSTVTLMIISILMFTSFTFEFA